MVLLAIDTAGPDCAVAVASAGGSPTLLATETERVGRGHSEIVMPMIARVLLAAGCGFADLDRVAVTVGPGSFTGIRAGIATARGLALALGIRAVGVGVLQALLEQAVSGGTGGVVAAALDARRSEVFAAATDGSIDDLSYPPIAGGPAAVAGDIAGLFSGEPISLTGSGAESLAAALRKLDVASTIVGRSESADIAAVARLGARAATGGAPSPVYLRGPDAKVQVGKAVARQ